MVVAAFQNVADVLPAIVPVRTADALRTVPHGIFLSTGLSRLGVITAETL